MRGRFGSELQGGETALVSERRWLPRRDRTGWRAVVSLLLVVTLLGFAAPAGATTPRSSGRGQAKPSATGLVRLPREVAPALADALSDGALRPVSPSSRASDTPLTLTVTLRRARQAAFERFLAAVETPHSAQFRHFLTQRQLAARFGPSRKAYDSVLGWLRSEGFTLVQGSANRLTLTVRGSEVEVQRAFDVGIEAYATRDGKRLYANVEDPALPAAIEPDVEGVSGLSNLGEPHVPDFASLYKNLHCEGATGFWDCVQKSSNNAANTVVNGPSPGSTTHGPLRLRVLNGPSVAATSDPQSPPADAGAGQKIGLLEFDTFDVSDVADFLSLAGSPATTANLSEVSVDGGVSTPGASEPEVLLDTDIAMSVSPGAHVVVYDGPPSAGFATMFNAMIDDDDTVISNSYTSCEDQVSQAEADSINSILAQAAAAGISVLNATGDAGSSCFDGSTDTVTVPADSPNATAVGGTSLTPGPADTYGSSTWWDGANATPQTGAGGFGVSKYFSVPSYQDSETSASGRSVPDVALPADPTAPGYEICEADAGGCPDGLSYGGTSASTPLMAAEVATINARLGHDLGALNPDLYALSGTDAFHSAASMGSDFFHVGLGTPNVDVLSLALQHASAGPVSGSASYTIDNADGNPTPADGSTADDVVVFLRDANGNSVSGKTVSLTADAGSSATVTPVNDVTTVDNGAATFEVTDTTAEQVTLTPTDTTDNVTLSPVTIDFSVPGAAGSEITSYQTDASDATVTVYLEDSLGRPEPGQTVSLSQTGSGTITPADAEQTTDDNGDATFTVNDANAETDTFTATDVTDGNLPVPGSVTVNFNSSSVSCDPGPPSTSPPYAISNWATDVPFNANAFYVSGVYFGPCDGVGQPAFDASGNAYLPDNVDGLIYEVGAGGGVVGASDALPDADFSGDDLDGVAVDKDGNLYAALGAVGGNFGDPEIVQLDPSTGAIERVVADASTGLGACPGEMAADPVSGDLFITDFCTFGNTDELEEIVDPSSTSPTVNADYATLPSTGGIGTDGIAIDPAGTIYLAVPGSQNPVVSVAGPSSASAGTVTVLDDDSSGSDPDVNIVGVAVAATDASGNATALYATTGDYGFTQGVSGQVLRLDDIGTSPVTGTTVTEPRSGVGLGYPATSPNGCTYVGATDVVYQLNSGSGCSSVANPAPTVTLTSSGPSPAPVGSSVTYTATLSNFSSGSGVPVTFAVTGANGQAKLVSTGSDGTATFTEQGVLSGGDSVIASATDASGDVVSSAPVVQRWITGDGSKDVTFLDLNASQQGGAPGSPATLSASLLDISQDPATTISGQTVTLGIDGKTCSAQTDGSGVASCQVTPSASGLLPLTASYSGDASYVAASSTADFSSEMGSGSTGGGSGGPPGGGAPGGGGPGTPSVATQTALRASKDPVTAGTSVTYDATVSPSPSGGTVAFTDAGATITGCGAVAVSGGQATCSVSYATAGSHLVLATYSGAGGFAGSQSPALSEVVTGAGVTAPEHTTTGLRSSDALAVTGQRVVYTVTVAPAVGAGTVRFVSDARTIPGCGAVAVHGGVARCAVVYRQPGRYLLQAGYSGTTGFVGSRSSALVERVRWSLTVQRTKAVADAVLLTLACAPGSGGCDVSIILRTEPGSQQVLTLATLNRRLSAGRAIQLTLPVDAAARKRLAAARSLRAELSVDLVLDGQYLTVLTRHVVVPS